MTSAGAIKFYVNHLYPGRCPLRSSRFSTPTFRSVNHFSHPFFSETEMQKHEELSRNERDAFVLMYTAHTCTYHGCLSFIFTFHASHFATRQETEKGNEKGWSSLERELSKKKGRNWIHFGDGFKFDERLERELTNNFAFSSDNLNPFFKGGSLGKIREGM